MRRRHGREPSGRRGCSGSIWVCWRRGGVALAFGVIPVNDITIMLGMALGCGALLHVLYRA